MNPVLNCLCSITTSDSSINPFLKESFASPTAEPEQESQEVNSPVIPAEVPRQTRDPELAERAGIQENQTPLDPGDSVPVKAVSRGDGSGSSLLSRRTSCP